LRSYTWVVYTLLSLGSQDPRGPPAKCGTHRVNRRYCVRSVRKINIRQRFMFSIFMHLIRLRVDNARVFQRDFNVTVGQAAC